MVNCLSLTPHGEFGLLELNSNWATAIPWYWLGHRMFIGILTMAYYNPYITGYCNSLYTTNNQDVGHCSTPFNHKPGLASEVMRPSCSDSITVHCFAAIVVCINDCYGENGQLGSIHTFFLTKKHTWNSWKPVHMMTSHPSSKISEFHTYIYIHIHIHR